MAVGAGLGRASVPEPPAHALPAPPAVEHPDAAAGPAAALAATLVAERLSALALAAQVRGLESLLADLGEAGGPELLGRAIGALSDDELRSVLASTVHLDADELGAVRDVRAFAARLAEVAMADVVAPAGGDAANARVVFATRPDPGAADAATRFPADTRRIYAVFPTDGGDDAVMVKWYRRDDPAILLFQRYPVLPGDARGYVWLDPGDGWEPGRYQVGVYAADEAVTLLAAGRYSVE